MTNLAEIILLTLAVLAAPVALQGGRGSRTAMALLANYFVALLLEHFAVPFDPLIWMIPDMMVVVAILQPPRSARTIATAALFLPLWLTYAITSDPDALYVVGMVVVICQFALCLPDLGRPRDAGAYRNFRCNPREYIKRIFLKFGLAW